MPILEQYKEIVEETPTSFSKLWNFLIYACYFTGAVSGYVTAMTFSMLWFNICDGKCPFWAKSHLLHHTEIEHHINNVNETNLHGENVTISVLNDFDWVQDVLVVFTKHETFCNLFLIINICSCVFGVVWFVMLLICSKSEYNTRTLLKSWKMVIPALIFDIIFLIPCIIVIYAFEVGYADFSSNLHKQSTLILSSHNLSVNKRECDSVSDLFKSVNHGQNVCIIVLITRISVFIMIISWFTNFLVLLVRMSLVPDFKVFKITIHDVPSKCSPVDAVRRVRYKLSKQY